MYLRLSKAVSVVLHPFLVPLYMVSLLLLAGTVFRFIRSRSRYTLFG